VWGNGRGCCWGVPFPLYAAPWTGRRALRGPKAQQLASPSGAQRRGAHPFGGQVVLKLVGLTRHIEITPSNPPHSPHALQSPMVPMPRFLVSARRSVFVIIIKATAHRQ
jgi:hypothetical protein